MSDNKCAKCGNYSGGATLCNACQKEALKKPKLVNYGELEERVILKTLEELPRLLWAAKMVVCSAPLHLIPKEKEYRPFVCALDELLKVLKKIEGET